MGFLKAIKEFFNPTYEPLVCKPIDIYDLLKEDWDGKLGGVPLIVEHNGQQYRMGSSCDYNKYRKEDNGFFDYEFYVGETKYKSLEEFWVLAMIDGEYLSRMPSITIVAQEMDGVGEYGDIRYFPMINERYPKTH